MREVGQTGWTNSYPVTRAFGLPVSYRAVGRVVSGVDFGNYEQASVHGYKFNDLNDNGVDNSEPRLAGCDDRAGRHQRPGQCGLGQPRRRRPTASIRSPAWRRGRTR